MIRKVTPSETATRRHILRAALKVFAHRGFAGASVQEIVAAARVSKPALYYYFKDKADLYRALVNEAHDERYRIISEAAARHHTIKKKLVEIMAASFEYFEQNRELMRLAFSTPLAAPGELPPNLGHIPKCRRNMEYIYTLIKEAQSRGELTGAFDSRKLGYSFYGQMNFYVASQLLLMEPRLDRACAQCVVDLFFEGAKPRKNASRKTRSNGPAQELSRVGTKSGKLRYEN